MKYPLSDLLRIRSRREDAAARGVVRARNALDDARGELERRIRERDAFAERRAREEEALWRSVFRPGVKTVEIDDLKRDIEALKILALEYDRAVQAAEESVAAAEQALEEARAAHRQTRADLERLSEHRKAWQERVDREAEAALEKELEEVPVRGPDWW